MPQPLAPASDSPQPEAGDILPGLRTRFDTASRGCVDDPFANPHLIFALGLTQALEDSRLTLAQVGDAVQTLTADAFDARAERLGAYLDAPDPERDRRRLIALFESLAVQGFDAYAALIARPAAGMVTTAHPTFALNAELSLAMVELATGRDARGEALDLEARGARHALARSRPHGPPPELTLDVEHAWSVRALTNVVQALEAAREAALEVGRRHWPERWTELSPQLLTLATWVGFDQDGRNDVTWEISFAKRLALKLAALEHRRDLLAELDAPAAQRLVAQALEAVTRQIDELDAVQGDAARLAAFARRLVAERDSALCDPAPLAQAADEALARTSSDEARARLVALKAGLAAQGLCLAHIHVRLNSAQLHNAVRREVGLETSPADPANRRSYFAAVNGLIDGCRPQAVNFESLLAEPTTAKRLFITIAQMAKFIDATAPVRFLIAETESGFTLLAALYFARLFGVEHLVEISPLFETEEAFNRGEAVIEEALKSPHYRAYVRAQGRIAVQFGFSDSGRFIGQMAATFRIERLRLRLAELLEREGLTDLEIVLFNTHGESIGRGGHPASLADRLAYAAPARDRAAFKSRGFRAREEDSFQGGDGYLPLFTPTAALATVRGVLDFAYAPERAEIMDEGADDPIYDNPGFAAEFFATVQQAFSGLGADADYPALLGLFSTRLLLKAGSRPEKRDNAGGGRVSTLSRVSELRAIPNNAILQGLGELANTTFGVSRAAAKDRRRFEEMHARSPRFRRALGMAAMAHELSDLQATRAYASLVNPSLWLDRRHAGDSDTLAAVLTDMAEGAGLTGRLSQVLRRLRAEPAFPLPTPDSPRRARVRLLHAIRVGLMQEAALIAARIPPFAPRQDVSRESLRLQILRLDLGRAAESLTHLFPQQTEERADGLDFGEPASYLAEERHGYARENATLVRPLLAIRDILLQTTCALNHDMGACG